jgi:hypothetical protein
MKKNGAVFIILPVIVTLKILTSCVTTDKINRADKDFFLDNSSYSRLNGGYSNMELNGKWSVYNIFYAYKTFHKRIENKRVIVMLKAISEKKMLLSYMVGDTCVRKVTLRGEFKNGYFALKSRYSVLNPAFPLLWGPSYYYRSLGLTKNNDLVIKDSRGGAGLILVIPFWDGHQSQHEFKRIE